MQTASNKYILTQEDKLYFQKFVAKDGEEYGLRFGNPNDAITISRIFKEIYGFEYVNPIVYNINLLKRELSKKNNLWFIGESIKNNEIAGAGLIEVDRYIAHASKAVTKKKYQGQGITTKIGAAGILTVTKMPQFDNVLRLDSDVRSSSIRSQKLIENAGAVPYGLIPAYNNFGDKRHYNLDENKPFPPQTEEGAFLYSILFKNLWNKRDKNVYLLNNEDVIFFYEFIKKISKKMNNDILILENGIKNKGYELYGVSKEPYNGIVKLYGYIKEKSLNNLLKTYRDWRIILWRIPTIKNGISSMCLALSKGFKIVGYDIGFNNINWTLYDSVIFAYYPKCNYGCLEVNCTNTPKPLVKKIKESFRS